MINKVLRVMFFVYIWPFDKLLKAGKLHRHVARISVSRRRKIYATCIKCKKFTLTPWWPMWRWER